MRTLGWSTAQRFPANVSSSRKDAFLGAPPRLASAPVDAAIKDRFAEQYKAWKENREANNGYSLEEWPVVTRKQINELNANNMFSINDVAAVTDGNLYCVHTRPPRLSDIPS